MNQGRRCERPGCRAWAMRGQEFCRAHVRLEDIELEAGPDVGMGPAQERAYRELVEQRITTALERVSSDRGSRDALAEEINALRLVLARLLAEEENPARLATSIPRVVDSVIRAQRAQRARQHERQRDPRVFVWLRGAEQLHFEAWQY